MNTPRTDEAWKQAEAACFRHDDETGMHGSYESVAVMMLKYARTLELELGRLDAELREERCLCVENRDAADASAQLLRRIFRGDHGLCVCTADNWKVTHLLCNQHALEAFLRGHDALANAKDETRGR